MSEDTSGFFHDLYLDLMGADEIAEHEGSESAKYIAAFKDTVWENRTLVMELVRPIDDPSGLLDELAVANVKWQLQCDGWIADVRARGQEVSSEMEEVMRRSNNVKLLAYLKKLRHALAPFARASRMAKRISTASNPKSPDHFVKAEDYATAEEMFWQ